MDRRHFLALTAATLPAIRTFAQSPAPATLALHPDEPGPVVPSNFLGLSYETQQLADPAFFSSSNTGLVAQFKALASRGVLRLGGNTSDYGFWKPTPDSVPPPRPLRPNKVGDPPPDLFYGVTPLAVENLRAFLDATGWTCLYGINLGTNTPALAADEAAFVARTLGDRLEYFQVGNEADRFASTIRDPKLTGHPWNADAFFDEWLTFVNAIREKLPYGARFGMPDIASNASWFTTLGARLAAMPDRCCPDDTKLPCDCIEAKYDPRRRPDIACLSHHYYIGGPPSNPEMTIQHILTADPRVPRDAALVQASAAKLGTRYRMTEGNTCFRGGKPGVSDVFAAALWSADYLLLLASLGYAGVNLHGGDAQMVANSLGGKLPGDDLVLAGHGDPSTHPHPYYTPIAHIGSDYIAEPVSYGMRFAGMFAGATMIPLDFNPRNGSSPVNATAYAAKQPNGQMLLAFINKDATQPLPLPANGSNWVPSLVLHAPSLSAREAHLDTSVRTRLSAVPPATAMLFGRFAA